MLRGPDLLAASPRVKGVTRFGRDGYCASADRGMYNGYDAPFGSLDFFDAIYINVTSDPSVPKVSGTLRYLDGTRATYRLTGGPLAGTNPDPAAAPALADIAGDWSMTNADRQSVQLSVASDGKIVGAVMGCAMTGTYKPTRTA